MAKMAITCGVEVDYLPYYTDLLPDLRRKCFSMWSEYFDERSRSKVHVLRETQLPLEVALAMGPDVQFVLKYIDSGISVLISAPEIMAFVRKQPNFCQLTDGQMEINDG
ncbi:hypothetical protein ACJJTC_009456 [Scirpophaga incertulas]